MAIMFCVYPWHFLLLVTWIIGDWTINGVEASKTNESNDSPRHSAAYPCTIPRWNTSELEQRFPPHGQLPALYPSPVILVRDVDDNEWFRTVATTRDGLIDQLGHNLSVTVSSSNSFSEHKRAMNLVEYLNHSWHQAETPYEQHSNESLYLFGETYSPPWHALLSHYQLPSCTTCQSDKVALSFGIGNVHSGVSWHVHGPGFSEVLHGHKHWILHPPDVQTTLNRSHTRSASIPPSWLEVDASTNSTTRPPRLRSPIFHDENQSTRQWMVDVYPYIDPSPHQCTLGPGEALYFPNQWWHATLNLDRYTAFLSTFTTEHATSNGASTTLAIQREATETCRPPWSKERTRFEQ